MRFPVGNDPNFWLEYIYWQYNLFICQIKFLEVIQGVTTQIVKIFVAFNQRWYYVFCQILVNECIDISHTSTI